MTSSNDALETTPHTEIKYVHIYHLGISKKYPNLLYSSQEREYLLLGIPSVQQLGGSTLLHLLPANLFIPLNAT